MNDQVLDEGSPPTPSEKGQPVPRLGMSLAAKFFVIAFLTVLLVVPLLMVWALTEERDYRQREVLEKINRDWGGAQTIDGPMLIVPFTHAIDVKQADGTYEKVIEQKFAVFLPETFSGAVETETEVRSISIFETAVYNARLTAKGRFAPVVPEDFGRPVFVEDIAWDQAVIGLRISDKVGIEEVKMTVGSSTRPLVFEPGEGPLKSERFPGIVAALPPMPLGSAFLRDGFDFDLTLRLRGSGALSFMPAGRETVLSMTADWPHPVFSGRILPSEREVNEKGFSATWRVPYLAREVPQIRITTNALDDYIYTMQLIGVQFDDPVDFYALIERALKYAVMFIAAIFGVVYFLEILSRRRIHVVQYTLVGLINVFFYILLLALSEHIGFTPAYIAASSATTLVIGGFTGLALKSAFRGLLALIGLGALFALLYAVLLLEDMALVTGAIAGFLVLSVVLFATRKVDWSGKTLAAEKTTAS